MSILIMKRDKKNACKISVFRHMEGYPNSYEFMRNCGCEDILNNVISILVL